MLSRALSIVLLLASAALAACRSQQNQDATIARLLETIGEQSRYFVEFGFNADSWEGGSGANSHALWARGDAEELRTRGGEFDQAEPPASEAVLQAPRRAASAGVHRQGRRHR